MGMFKKKEEPKKKEESKKKEENKKGENESKLNDTAKPLKHDDIEIEMEFDDKKKSNKTDIELGKTQDK